MVEEREQPIEWPPRSWREKKKIMSDLCTPLAYRGKKVKSGSFEQNDLAEGSSYLKRERSKKQIR